jgi:hypothetical protein
MQLQLIFVLALIFLSDALKFRTILSRRVVNGLISVAALGFFTTTPVVNYYNEGIHINFNSIAPANADENKTKKFELCMSKCIYQGTRPPPVGSSNERLEETSSRSRGEIAFECKRGCAVTKGQLLTGKPKDAKVAAEDK